MEKKEKIDQQKVLLFLPQVLIVIVTSAFFAMGGGKPKDASMPPGSGLNTSLPDAQPEKKLPEDKLGYYEQQALDSARRKSGNLEHMISQLGFQSPAGEPQEQQINARLEALNREISRPEENRYAGTASVAVKPAVSDPGLRQDVDRLEALMKSMQENKSDGNDPEMQQLSSLMQNILDIQHPELVKQRYAIGANPGSDSLFKAIPAVIATARKVVQGATIKLLLLDTMRVNGVLIPKGHELFGACRITNQRLLLDIKQIRLGDAIIPADLSMYSYDGMLGLDAPEAVLTDALNDGTRNAIGDIGLNGFDQSLGVQIAGAGIDAARDMLSKKLRKIKVKLEAGKAVLLRNNAVKTR